MNKNLLRAPLINSAVLLAVLTLIIYLTVTSHDGGIFSSIGTIIYAVFKVIQLGIALILSFILCLAIFIGIFLGGMAIVSTDSATRMYNQLVQVLSEKVGFIKLPVKKEGGRSASAGVSLEALKASLQDEMAGQVDSSVQNVQRSIDERFQDIQSRVEQIESDDSSSAISDRLQVQEEKVSAVEEAVGSGTGEIQKLQEQLQAISQQLQNLSSDTGKADLTEKIASLESTTNEFKSYSSSLAEKFESLQGDVDALKSVREQEAQEVAPEEAEDDSEHRLFSYIDDQEEQEKIGQLVAEGLQNEMTYAQIMDQLAEQMNNTTAEILADHPTLTKEYIRHVKNMS